MKPLFISSLITTALLSGCGGSSSSSGDPGTGNPGEDLDIRITNPATELSGSFKYFAYFDLISDDLLDRVNYDANFLEMVDVQPASVFENSVPPRVDACNLRITETIPTDVSVIGFPNAQFNLVSAGETYTLTGDAGSYTTIDRSADRFEIGSYPVPEPLTVDIPGDVFPGFTAVDVPSAIRVQGISSTVDRNTTLTWTPSGIDGNSVYIRTFEFPSADRVVNLMCRMADDGEFQLPADVVTALSDALGTDFTLSGIEQYRSAFNVVIQGDALLVVGKNHQ